ncbi:hypothetical protein CSB66_1468 [Enterobacter hormaechei]|nr:hypothetical protein CSB66_1468 [Enterobacter hormaechei]
MYVTTSRTCPHSFTKGRPRVISLQEFSSRCDWVQHHFAD